MDICCDAKQESDPKRSDPEQTSEQEIEDNVRDDKFLRSNDSDESEDSDSTLKSRSDSKDGSDYKKSNECQNINVKTDSNQTLITSNPSGDKPSETTETQSKPELKVSSKANTNQKERDQKISILMPKWGESVGITDENGNIKRVINLTEMKNYLQLRLKLVSMFKFYFSLIDSRYPQLFKNFDSGEQRWRMRYNIFVDGVFGSDKKSDSIVHVGEIHIYFDIGKYLSHPYYVNCSFYGNYQPLKRSVDSSRITKMIVNLHSILTSNDMLQLKFPIPKRAFKNIDSLFYKFIQRQYDMMQALCAINDDKHWIPNGKWLSIDPKYKFKDLYQNYNRIPISQRIGDRIGKYRKGRNREEVTRYSSGVGSKPEKTEPNHRSEEQVTHTSNKKIEERIGRKFFATKTINHSSTGRPRDGFRDEVYANAAYIPLREKVSTNSDHKVVTNDRNQTNLFARRTYHRRNRSLDRNDEKNESDVRAIKPFRSVRNGESRSRPKTKRIR